MKKEYETRLEKVTHKIQGILSGKIKLHNPGLVLQSLEVLRERLLVAIELETPLIFIVD